MKERALGIDVSHYQGAVGWTGVRSGGISFAVVKATEGTSHVDAAFAANWKRAGEAGLIRGAYHFFRPQRDAERQAALFAQTVKLRPDDLPPVLDVETADGIAGTDLGRGVRTWLETVRKLTGRQPLLYTGPAFWDEHMSGDFSEYPLWIAHYTEKPRPRLPKGWKRWTLWQYTDQGRVSGIGGRCDLDRFRGSLAELRAFAGGGTLPPPDFPPLSGPGEKTYSVQPGDTLSGIALRFGVTVSALVQVNHLEDPHLIFVGQVLHLATG